MELRKRVPPGVRGPKEGDPILFCEHADVEDGEYIDISANACPDQPFHWLYVWTGKSEKLEITNKDTGEILTIRWICVCDKCNTQGVGRGLQMPGRPARWIGEPPNIIGVQ